MVMFKKILVAVDGTPCSENAACTAFAMARRMGARVMLTSVVLKPRNAGEWAWQNFVHQKAETDELLHRWARIGEAGWEIAVDSSLLEGEHVAEEIIKYAEDGDFDFLLIGTHGRTGLEHRLLGSVAERVARGSSIPVMIARRKDTDPRWHLGEAEHAKRQGEAEHAKRLGEAEHAKRQSSETTTPEGGTTHV
jgi:nucleotide-binding universal stress UspA family protein